MFTSNMCINEPRDGSLIRLGSNYLWLNLLFSKAASILSTSNALGSDESFICLVGPFY